MTVIMDGKSVANQILASLSAHLKSTSLKPHLCVFQVGDRLDSNLYIKMKKSASERVGILFSHCKFPSTINETDLIKEIETANQNPDIHAIIVQLPLPAHIRTENVLDAVQIDKDVDGFNTMNIGLLAKMQAPMFVPCTPAAILHMLRYYGITLAGKHISIVGRGMVVGRPLSLLMNMEDATVSLCHSLTTNISQITRISDVVIAAAGHERLVTEDWVKEGAVVIDVGISKDKDGRVVGDVDFEHIIKKVSYFSPVPGGIGPVTVAKLLENTMKSAQQFQHKRNTEHL